MRREVALFYIMRIVARNDLYIIFLCKLYQYFVYFILFCHTMTLQFHIKILLKNVEPPFEFIFAFLFSFFQNGLRYRCPKATSSCNKAFMILEYKFFIYPWVFAIH